MKRMAFVPLWAWQFVIGAVVVLLAITIASTRIGAAMRVRSACSTAASAGPARGRSPRRASAPSRPDVGSLRYDSEAAVASSEQRGPAEKIVSDDAAQEARTNGKATLRWPFHAGREPSLPMKPCGTR